MPLTLKIVSKQRHILGADSLRVFSVHGGSIGRAPDNDWVLPDPDRYISGHHASIDYREGAYYLRDRSTNGVYVNQSEQPVGRGAPIRLYDGDELRMGDYVFDVSIVNVSRDGADDSGDSARPSRPGKAAATKDRVPVLSLKLLGDEADEMEDAALSAGAAADAARSADEEALAEAEVAEAFAQTMRLGEEFSGTQTNVGGAASASVDRQRVTELRLADSALIRMEDSDPDEGRRAAYTAGGPKDFTEAVRLLMASLGLDSTQLPRGEEEQLMEVAGTMLRTTAAGLVSLLRHNALVKAQFRLAQPTLQPVGNNPLKFANTAQEALEQLFYERGEGYLRPVEAIEDSFKYLRAHETAMVKAMQVAFRDLLGRLDPAVLEERFQRTVKRGGLLSPSAQSQYWDMYREAYRGLAGFTDENFAGIVGGKFADAYDRELHQLMTSVAKDAPQQGARKRPSRNKD
jgi:type VI secretion system protein